MPLLPNQPKGNRWEPFLGKETEQSLIEQAWVCDVRFKDSVLIFLYFNSIKMKIITYWRRAKTYPRSEFFWRPNRRSIKPICIMAHLLECNGLSVLQLTIFTGIQQRIYKNEAFAWSSIFSHLFRPKPKTSLIFCWSYDFFVKTMKIFVWIYFWPRIFLWELMFVATRAWRGRLWWNYCIWKEHCILFSAFPLFFLGYSLESSSDLSRKQWSGFFFWISRDSFLPI